MREITVKRSTSAVNHIILSSTTSGNTEGVTITSVTEPKFSDDERDVVDAVYAYIQAMRSLGRKTINTMEIVRALRLPHAVVRSAVSELGDRGVKAIDAR